MKSHKEILINHYGCKTLKELQDYLGDVSITMITESMDIAAKQAFEAANLMESDVKYKYEKFEDYLKDLENDTN